MSDVAQIAGVSAMTVSRALRDPSVVTPDTLKKVHAAIETIGYLPNRIAGSLSSRRARIVGLIVPSLRNSLFAETIQGVADVLGRDLDLMIANSGYTLRQEEAAVVAFLSQRVCGIILHNTKHTVRVRKLIKESGIPCVETGNLSANPIDISVSFSNFEASKTMTERLIQRGYKRIGFVSLPLKDNDRAAERRSGYIAALEGNGRTPDPSYILEALPGLNGGGDALAKLIDTVPRIDAVFMTGDVLAIGAILEANRRGIKVPDELAIVGSDDTELQEKLVPPLTSIRFPRYEIGRMAANFLIDRVTGRSSASATVDLGFRIIERASG